MSVVRMIHIVLKAKPSKVVFFLAVMQAIAAAMQAHASTFVNSPVDLGVFKKQCDNLASLQQSARAKVPGAAADRDAALRIVAASAELLRAFVEQLCNASPEQSATIAQSAAMQISSRPVRAKVPLWARQGLNPGVVLLYASVALLVTGKGGRFFSWEWSGDGGATWVAVPPRPRRGPPSPGSRCSRSASSGCA
jgi:hypothetical protein